MTWHPLVAAIETCLTRHHTGSNQPVTPAPWMTAAAEQIADAITRATAITRTTVYGKVDTTQLRRLIARNLNEHENEPA